MERLSICCNAKSLIPIRDDLGMCSRCRDNAAFYHDPQECEHKNTEKMYREEYSDAFKHLAGEMCLDCGEFL